MSEKTLSQVASLLEDAMKVHKAISNIVLCTREGVVVAAISKDSGDDAQVLSTVAAALTWGGIATMDHIGLARPSYFIHSAKSKQTLTVVQKNFQLVVVFSLKDSQIVEQLIPRFQPIATRVELVMSSSEAFGGETILDKIVKAIPSIGKAMLLTLEGMPIGSVGFEEQIEVAALASSIFANGLTLSKETESIVVGTEKTKLLLARVDDKRLVAVVCGVDEIQKLCAQVKELVI